jgi:DNA-binding protein Fis
MKIRLILEKEGGSLWGRVSYDKNLIVDSAATLPVLQNKLKKALKEFHNLDGVEFEYQYDLTAFFEQFNFLNQSKIAELSGINPGLLRQYASGVKHPSKEQAQKIQTAIRDLAARLKSVKIYA